MTDTKGVVLHIEDIHKRYGDLEVLKGISFSVKKGEVKVVIGSSGAGKSTLLRCINRLTVPDSGKVWLDDEEITNSNVTRCRYKMGMVFQDFNLFDHLTALKNVEIGLIRVKRLPKRQARERAVEELRRVGRRALGRSETAGLHRPGTGHGP